MKNGLLTSLLIILSFSSPIIASQGNSSQNAMIKELEVAKYNLSIKYAPAEWKQESLGWNVDEAFEKSKNRILIENPSTSKQYQKIFKEFLNSTKDYHVKSIFYSTEYSFFPLKVKGVNGRYFITGFDLSITLSGDEISFLCDTPNEEMFADMANIRVGDEVVTFDGMPIKEVIEKIIDEELGGDRSPTGYALAERTLFLRFGKYGHKVPSGTFQLGILHKGEKKSILCNLPWIYTPEWINDRVLKGSGPKGSLNPFAKAKGKESKSGESLANMLSKDYSVGFAKDIVSFNTSKWVKEAKAFCNIKNSPDEEDDDDNDFREKGFLPPLGKILWEIDQESEIYAYLYKNSAGQKIGYIYLPSFMYTGKMAELRIKEICQALEVFNSESAALVFDITNNPGGDLFFLYAVLSTLADKPLKLFTQREILIQEDVYRAASIYNSLKNDLDEMDDAETESKEPEGTLNGYLLNKSVCQHIIEYSQLIMKSWETGDKMTQPLFIYGISEIIPHPVANYSKPILVLTNELDFSCADLFPAILQDNKRVRIFGKKTAGAGGYVKGYGHASQFGISAYTLTGSIAYRLNGKPIENIGVTPDVPYELTQKDVREEYVDYINAVNVEVKSMLKKNKK